MYIIYSNLYTWKHCREKKEIIDTLGTLLRFYTLNPDIIQELKVQICFC